MNAARDVYSKILSDNLNLLMKLHGYTRKQVSAGINVPYTTYTDWVKGKSYPQIEGLQRLAEFFHIEVSDLSRDILSDKTTMKRLETYAQKTMDFDKEEQYMFEHKSLQQRIDEYDGKLEICEYDWSDLLEGDYFGE